MSEPCHNGNHEKRNDGSCVSCDRIKTLGPYSYPETGGIERLINFIDNSHRVSAKEYVLISDARAELRRMSGMLKAHEND